MGEFISTPVKEKITEDDEDLNVKKNPKKNNKK